MILFQRLEQSPTLSVFMQELKAIVVCLKRGHVNAPTFTVTSPQQSDKTTNFSGDATHILLLYLGPTGKTDA